MPMIEVGLATRSARVCLADLQPVAAALDQQAQRDVGPAWDVCARVTVFQDADRVPAHMWPIILVDDMPGAMHGVHAADHGTSFALIQAAEGWPHAASHEFVEMLVDPSGEAMRPGRGLTLVDGAVADAADDVDYILEACDPVEDESHGYLIGGVLVSDFYYPSYFDNAAAPGVRYSHNGGVSGPRQVAQNGYLSWHDPRTGLLQQLKMFGGPQIITLGNHPGAATADRAPLRQFVDARTETPRTARIAQRWPARPKAG